MQANTQSQSYCTTFNFTQPHKNRHQKKSQKVWTTKNIYRNIAILNLITKMGATKTDHFTDQQNQIATIAKALGHPARVAIIEYLLTVDTCICGDIVNELPLAQATVSQHLKELKNAGLIKGNIEGNSICYCIDENTFGILKTYFSNIITKVTEQKCC